MSFNDALERHGGDAAAAVAAIFAEAPVKRTVTERFADSDTEDADSVVPSRRRTAADDDYSAFFPGEDEEAEIPMAMRTAFAVIGQERAKPAAFNIMLRLAPDELPAACRTNRIFAEVCASNAFRAAYRKEWFITVRMHGEPMWDPQVDLQMRKTRTVGELVSAFEVRANWQRNGRLVTVLSLTDEPWETPYRVDAASSLEGMRLAQSPDAVRDLPDGVDLVLEYDHVVRIKSPDVVRNYNRLYLEDGTFVDQYSGYA